VKLDVHYQRNQENIALSLTANMTHDKTKVGRATPIYTPIFLWRVASLGSVGQHLRLDGRANFSTSTETPL
jgi:hypothetical protein